MTAPPPALPEWTPLATSPGTTDPTVPLSAPGPLLVKGPRSPHEAAPLARSLRVSNDRTVLRRRLMYVRDHVLKRFELYAATMTIAFLGFASGLVWADAGASTTFVVAVVGMGAIQMSIQWAIQERERRLRAQAVAEIREMLRDRVLNQLAVVRIRTAGDPQCTDLQ
ncbi:hypothetical protein [Rubrivirga marina]|uniref:Uncharacterized protein n=1 Tax=Rubrivirga marina TaxID=1196024 RepID=A0A271IXS8_9BACT|nr:hypothetical protein [Rubrivirga marina]PAP76056.1 hypothetical protein BSZ37_06170 [Rubrivirga marina]